MATTVAPRHPQKPCRAFGSNRFGRLRVATMDLCRVDMRRQRKSGVMCLTPAAPLPLSRDPRGGGGVTEVAAEGG